MDVLYVRNREELDHQIITLHADGWPIRKLTRHFCMSRNTIRRILRKNKSRRNHGHDVLSERSKKPRKSKLTAYLPLMKDLLEKFPDITGVRMFEELADAGFDGGKTIVMDRLKQMRPSPKREPVVRFETDPGEQGQMDWSPYTIPFVKTGKITVQCFSYILGYSRRQYIDFTMNHNFFTLIRRHIDAFEYFGGAPHSCLYDNEKTVVLRWEAGRPLYNPAFIAFITHYCCKPRACKPRTPRTKGKVEAPFQYVCQNLLNGRLFQDLEDLRITARWWLKEKSDLHIHDTTRRAPLELFMMDEQKALFPLPKHPYDVSEVALRVCRLDGFLEHETNLYSVPYEHVADILTLKAGEYEICIYTPELELIARHERIPAGAGKKVENPEHRKNKKVRYGLEPVKDSFLMLGDSAEAFLTGLKERHPRNCGFHARSILAMKEHYHVDDIHRALAHAIRYYAFEAASIERILKARAPKRTLESIRNQNAGVFLEKSLPPVKQRSLDEYAQLIKRR